MNRLTSTGVSAQCTYCLKGSDDCLSVQLRAGRNDEWQEPILACTSCRGYFRRNLPGDWRHTPGDIGYVIVSVAKIVQKAAVQA